MTGRFIKLAICFAVVISLSQGLVFSFEPALAQAPYIDLTGEQDKGINGTGSTRYNATISTNTFAAFAIGWVRTNTGLNTTGKMYIYNGDAICGDGYCGTPLNLTTGNQKEIGVAIIDGRKSSTDRYFPYVNVSKKDYTFLIEYEGDEISVPELTVGNPIIGVTMDAYELIDIYSAHMYAGHTYNISLETPAQSHYFLYIFGGFTPNTFKNLEDAEVVCSSWSSGTTQHIVYSPSITDNYCVLVVNDRTGTIDGMGFHHNYAIRMEEEYPAEDSSVSLKNFKIIGDVGTDVYASNGRIAKELGNMHGVFGFKAPGSITMKLHNDPMPGHQSWLVESVVSSGKIGLIVANGRIGEPQVCYYENDYTADFYRIEYEGLGTFPKRQLMPGSQVTEIMSEGELFDAFEAYLEAGIAYKISLINPSGAVFGLRLFNVGSDSPKNQDQAVAYSASTTSGATQSIAFTPQTQGYYCIVVTNDNNALGTLSYTIKIESAFIDPGLVYRFTPKEAAGDVGSPLVTEEQAKFTLTVDPNRFSAIAFNSTGTSSSSTTTLEVFESNGYVGVPLYSITSSKGAIKFVVLDGHVGTTARKYYIRFISSVPFNFEWEDAAHVPRLTNESQTFTPGGFSGDLINTYEVYLTLGKYYNVTLNPASNLIGYIYLLNGTYNSNATTTSYLKQSSIPMQGEYQYITYGVRNSGWYSVVVVNPYQATGSYQIRVIKERNDVDPPYVDINSISKPSGYGNLERKICGDVWDDIDVRSVEVSCDNVNYVPAVLTYKDVAKYTWEVTTFTFPRNGTYTVYARGTDIAGNEAIFQKPNVIIGTADTDIPTLRIEFPTEGAVLNRAQAQPLNISGYATDKVTIDSIVIAINTLPPVTIPSANIQFVSQTTTTKTFRWFYNAGDFGDGTYRVVVGASDGFHLTEKMVNFTINTSIPDDTIKPTVEITSPEEGQRFVFSAGTGSIDVEGTARDNVGVKRVEISLNGVDWMTCSGTTSWSYTLMDVPAGAVNIIVRAIDTSNNIGATQEITVYAEGPDNVLPEISILEPVSGQKVTSRTVIVKGVANDNKGIASVEVTVDNYSWLNCTLTQTPNGWQFTTQSLTLRLKEGTNQITARATDTSGNRKTTFVTVTYSKPSQENPMDTLIWGLAIIMIVTVLAVIILFFIMPKMKLAQTTPGYSYPPIGGPGVQSRYDSNMCEICGQSIIGPQPTVTCECGRKYHEACALRAGTCGRCFRKLSVGGPELPPQFAATQSEAMGVPGEQKPKGKLPPGYVKPDTGLSQGAGPKGKLPPGYVKPDTGLSQGTAPKGKLPPGYVKPDTGLSEGAEPKGKLPPGYVKGVPSVETEVVMDTSYSGEEVKETAYGETVSESSGVEPIGTPAQTQPMVSTVPSQGHLEEDPIAITNRINTVEASINDLRKMGVRTIDAEKSLRLAKTYLTSKNYKKSAYFTEKSEEALRKIQEEAGKGQ